jgi:hypothetical protein
MLESQLINWIPKEFSWNLSTERADIAAMLVVLGSNLCRERTFLTVFSWSSSVCLGKCRDNATTRLRKLPSKFIQIHYSSIILSFEAVVQLMTASWSNTNEYIINSVSLSVTVMSHSSQFTLRDHTCEVGTAVKWLTNLRPWHFIPIVLTEFVLFISWN